MIGQTGTIYFESAAKFEYHNDPEKTQASKDSLGRGWSTLGDIGYLDDEKFLYLTDRKAFMIIAGGVNIYPQEAENILVSHPDVIDVAVFGIPNDEFGEEVKAVVQPTVMPATPEEAKISNAFSSNTAKRLLLRSSVLSQLISELSFLVIPQANCINVC